MSGLKTMGFGSAGVRLWVVPARRTRLPATEIDWTERLRERKEGWRRRMWWRGGSCGGGGSVCQWFEIGSKVWNWIELGWGWFGLGWVG